MKCAFNTCIVLLTPFLLSSCSLYQSEGREFLEKQAFQFSNQGLSIAIVNQQDNCVQTDDGLTVQFFEAKDWELVAESFDPDYSLFEDRDPGLHSLVVAYTPIIQRDLYVCEFVYDSKQTLQQRQKEDLQKALETVHEMLN